MATNKTNEPVFDGTFVQHAEFTDPASRTWVDELLDRRQWMGHREKKPFAPWGDRDAPAECAKHDRTADECECDARWKWGYDGHYRAGDQVLSVLPMGEIDGLAFLQQDEDPYVFVDGDDVRCPDTGDVHPGFKAVLALLGATYCDVSVSGSGVHANYRGTVPDGVTEPSWELDDEPWGENDDVPAVEIYETTHVCVATGKHVPGTPVKVNEWSADALEGLLDATGHLTGDEDNTGNVGDIPALTDDETDDSTGDGDGHSGLPDGVTDDMQDVYDAVEALNAKRVADKTIVQEWRDPRGATYRAFLPTWGSSSDGGTANIVTEDVWKDKGRLGGYGGPVVMAAIDLGLVTPRNAEPGCVKGREYRRAVQHLRDLGFSILEYAPDRVATDRENTSDSPYFAVADDHAPAGADPFMDDAALLVACVAARDAGAVSEDADVPDRALRPLVRYVAGVDPDAASVGEESWNVARSVFDSLDERKARKRFYAAGNPGGEIA